MQLDDSIAAIVTGGASGLGEATARALRAHGVKVALFDMNVARGTEVAAEIDTMTRYIERDTAMFYRCHIRPILLEYDKVRNTAFDLYEIMFGNAGTKNIASAKSHRIIRLRRLKRQFTIERLT
jgi:NAD(P)-dependent dehydrogenase (short-subunit alcohol dehydrogenase family)